MARKKTLRAFLACLVAAMMLTSTVPAYAADPPEKSNLHIHKYTLTNITDSGRPGTGEPGSVPAEAEPVNGVVFKVYKVDASAGTPPAGKVYKVSGNTLVVYEADGTTQVGSPYAIAPVSTVTTGADGTGTASIKDLPHGIYVVAEDFAASNPKDVNGKAVTINVVSAPFIVAIPMTNAAGTDYLKDIHVYPKNGTITVEKETGVSDGDAVAVGDLVPYAITTTIPDGIEDYQQYIVKDELDKALDLVVPTAGNYNSAVQAVLLPDNTALVAGTDYVVRYNEATRLMEVDFKLGLGKLAGSDAVKVFFKAAVNDKILEAEKQTVGNEAKVSFTNKSGTVQEAGTDGTGPKVHIAGIQITKLDQAGAALSGATFKVATSEAKAKAGEFLRKDPATGILYDEGEPEWASLGAGADYAVSPVNVASFLGLRDKVGGAWQTYWVVETVAPTGYNLILDPIKVTFDPAVEDYLYLLEVTNHKGFTLPETGGMGTVLFVVGGIVLLGAAAIVLIAPWKRRKAQVNASA